MKLNKISKTLYATIAALTLVGSASAGPTEDFRNADTVKEARAAGGQQISGASIEKILKGRTFRKPEWTWTIHPNGTHSSEAKDGSWSDEGNWEIRGNQYCRNSTITKGKVICSKVYFLGKDLRFSQDENPRKLMDWFVSF